MLDINSMEESLKVIQLRSTIFLLQNIGYSAENVKDFSELLLPGSKPMSALPANITLGVDPKIPQYGMPWRLFKKENDFGEINIVFLQGKIDIILTAEYSYVSDIETRFTQKCVKWFSLILEKIKVDDVPRIAYAPTYAIKDNGFSQDNLWTKLLKKHSFKGASIENVNLSFLFKRLIPFGNENIQMNLLYTISDCVQTIVKDGVVEDNKMQLIQLDLNSIPEKQLRLKSTNIVSFFTNIQNVRKDLIAHVID